MDRLLSAGPSLLAASAPAPPSTPATPAAPAWSAADRAVQSYLGYLQLFCPQVDQAPPFPHVQACIEATDQCPAYQLAMGQR
ncbi:MAG: hypothetical protein WCQ20_08770 [Synechococcaceae cyanobacterium ELA739]